ncbi:hypothetical protein, partial [Frankia sp. AgKG'84/4]|uniref:hypothetical protein n=1 Tax=Frankia sp. AgKG'84/4 TaxID=573490 RepID=UPI00202A8F01
MPARNRSDLPDRDAPRASAGRLGRRRDHQDTAASADEARREEITEGLGFAEEEAGTVSGKREAPASRLTRRRLLAG